MKKRTSVTLTPKVFSLLEKLSDDTNIPKSLLVEKALEFFFDDYKEFLEEEGE